MQPSVCIVDRFPSSLSPSLSLTTFRTRGRAVHARPKGQHGAHEQEPGGQDGGEASKMGKVSINTLSKLTYQLMIYLCALVAVDCGLAFACVPVHSI